MKKILIAKNIHGALQKNSTFLNGTDFTVFVAETNDEVLNIHRKERVNLIITDLDMPGMSSEQLCSAIREDEKLRTVSMLMVCENTPEAIERSRQCRANAVLLHPVHPLVLEIKAQQLLDVAARETVRVLLSANVDGQPGGEVFYCRSRNISATGMLIETDHPLPEGARLTCLFYLPDAKKIQTACKVIRSIEPAPGDEDRLYGIMFTDITPETKRLLADFIEKTSRLSPSDDL
jgi:CheY-like chemotaxis protein